jgi:hypothetical protein
MSNLNETNVKNLAQLKTDLEFQTNSKFLIIKQLQRDNINLLQQSWEITKEQFNEVASSYNYYKSEKYREISTKFNVKLTSEMWANEIGMGKSNMLECVQCSKVKGNLIVKYENKHKETGLSRKGLLKFVADINKVSTEVDTNKETETETETNEVEVKNDVSIKVDRKKNKLVWKGVATLDILDMIILEAQRQKAELIKLAEKK